MQKLRRNLIKRAQCFKHFKRDCHSAPGIESIQDAFILDQLVVLHVSLHHFGSAKGLEKEYTPTKVSHYRVAILSKVVLSACVEFATGSTTLKVSCKSRNDEMQVDICSLWLGLFSSLVVPGCSENRRWRSEQMSIASNNPTWQSLLFSTKSNGEAFSSSEWRRWRSSFPSNWQRRFSGYFSYPTKSYASFDSIVTPLKSAWGSEKIVKG